LWAREAATDLWLGKEAQPLSLLKGQTMKNVLRVYALCLLAAALATGADSPAASRDPSGDAANQRRTPSGLLKTESSSVVTREVLGQGHNRDEAIKNALYRAVEQTRGVRVGSGNYEFGFRSAGAGIGADGPGRRSIEVDSIDVATQGTVYTTEIAGLIKGYDVLEEKQIDQDTYQVKLKVDVYDYGERGQTRRVKVALMPAKTLQSEYRFLNQTISADALSALFSQRLAVGLTQTNKFAVLDRESILDFVREKDMLISFDAPLKEQARLAETLGAEYLLAGTISQAQIERIDRYLKVADYTTSKFKARFNFSYRLIDSSTKQIVVASTAEKYLEDEQVRKLADEQNPAEWDAAQVRDAFISVVVNDVVEAVIDRVYPVIIAAVQEDGQIVLNQGGGRMAVGMQLDVFTEGKEVIDPDTGESLGRVESRIATVEVQRVTYTMSFAKVISGDEPKISKGLVCRPKGSKRILDAGAERDITRTKTGGVKLPFDK
jgi:curli biogenesis system outer membrane secretion channel CsgG